MVKTILDYTIDGIGLGLVVFGFWMLTPWLGVVVAGVSLLILNALIRSDQTVNEDEDLL